MQRFSCLQLRGQHRPDPGFPTPPSFWLRLSAQNACAAGWFSAGLIEQADNRKILVIINYTDSGVVLAEAKNIRRRQTQRVA